MQERERASGSVTERAYVCVCPEDRREMRCRMWCDVCVTGTRRVYVYVCVTERESVVCVL